MAPPANRSRRDFLLFSTAALLLAACGDGLRGPRPRIGLALGGGGAKGLAHIPMLETLDELGIRPAIIAGTSIGAVIGVLYAAGLSGAKIRSLIEQFLVDEDAAEKNIFALPQSLRWLDFIDPALANGGLLDSGDFIEFLGEATPARRFRDLEIPLRIVAADLQSGEQVILKSGDLLPAVQASMAVPGVFPPVELDGRVLVDGGVANPLPYDLLLDECDVVVAIDVSGNREIHNDKELSYIGVLMHTFHTMSNNILREKLKQRQPDIYIRPEIHNVRVLEFYKARQVFTEALPATHALARALRKLPGRGRERPGCSIQAR